MVNKKITDLTDLPTPVAADVIAIVDDVGGAGVATKKATLSNALAAYDAQTATLTGKSISLTTNTLTGTSLELKTAISDETGSGKLVFATSPTLTTPALGTPASGILSGCTVIPMAQASGILPDANMPNLTGAITTVAGAVDTTLSSGLTIADPTLTYSINAQTGTTFTPALADAGKIITTSNGSSIAVTIPPNSSVAYPIGSSLTIISIGAGLTTIGQGSGVTIASVGATATAPVLRAQHSSATAIKIATDTWQVVGDIS